MTKKAECFREEEYILNPQNASLCAQAVVLFDILKDTA